MNAAVASPFLFRRGGAEVTGKRINMISASKKLCHFCASEMKPGTVQCEQCGLDLKTMKFAKSRPKSESEDPYRIVVDGDKFGIAFQGEIKIHGLEPKEAQTILEILNCMLGETEGVFAG
jgi:hypothetical protein